MVGMTQQTEVTVEVGQPLMPHDGTGIIYVRNYGKPEDDQMEATWEDDLGRVFIFRGFSLAVLKIAFYLPSAETRLYRSQEEWTALDQDRYDALYYG
jgi:hypothetical protein